MWKRLLVWSLHAWHAFEHCIDALETHSSRIEQTNLDIIVLFSCSCLDIDQPSSTKYGGHNFLVQKGCTSPFIFWFAGTPATFLHHNLHTFKISYRIQLFLVVSELGAFTIWLGPVTSRMCCDYACEQVEGTYMDQRVWTSEYWKLGYIIKILLLLL